MLAFTALVVRCRRLVLAWMKMRRIDELMAVRKALSSFEHIGVVGVSFLAYASSKNDKRFCASSLKMTGCFKIFLMNENATNLWK